LFIIVLVRFYIRYLNTQHFSNNLFKFQGAIN